MIIHAILGNPNHPEYGVATIPFPIPHDQYAHCMELLGALKLAMQSKLTAKCKRSTAFILCSSTRKNSPSMWRS